MAIKVSTSCTGAMLEEAPWIDVMQIWSSVCRQSQSGSAVLMLVRGFETLCCAALPLNDIVVVTEHASSSSNAIPTNTAMPRCKECFARCSLAEQLSFALELVDRFQSGREVFPSIG